MRVAALRDDAGAIARLAVGSWVFDRVSWWRDPLVHQITFGACALLFAGTLAGLALGAAARRLPSQPKTRVSRAARAVAAIGAASALTALVAIVVGLMAISPFEFFIEVPAWLRATGLLAALAAPTALAVLAWSVAGRGWTPLARLHFAALGVALAVFAALAAHYNLVGWIG
jgi:hypothetical protein